MAIKSFEKANKETNTNDKSGSSLTDLLPLQDSVEKILKQLQKIDTNSHKLNKDYYN